MPRLPIATIPAIEWKFADLGSSTAVRPPILRIIIAWAAFGTNWPESGIPWGKGKVCLLNAKPKFARPLKRSRLFLCGITGHLVNRVQETKAAPKANRILSRQLSAPAYMQLATRALLRYFACAMAHQQPSQITALRCQHHNGSGLAVVHQASTGLQSN